MKTLLAFGVAVLLSTAALAQTSEYYVVQDAATKKCTVVHQKPTTSTTVVVGDGKVYKTQSEAETAMKSVKICSTM